MGVNQNRNMSSFSLRPAGEFFQSAQMYQQLPRIIPDMRIIPRMRPTPAPAAVLQRSRQEETCAMHAPLKPNLVRLITARHGSLEVPWSTFRICLLNMFDSSGVQSSFSAQKVFSSNLNTNNSSTADLSKVFTPQIEDPNDGYRWRKYGEKVLANQNRHRVYYRCTHHNCPAKKRREVDPATGNCDRVVTTQHNHEPPPKKIGLQTAAPPTAKRACSIQTSAPPPAKRACLLTSAPAHMKPLQVHRTVAPQAGTAVIALPSKPNHVVHAS